MASKKQAPVEPTVVEQTAVQSVASTQPQQVDVAAIVEAAVKAALASQQQSKGDLTQIAQVIADSTKGAIDAANPRAMTAQKRKELGYGKSAFDPPAGKTKKLNGDFYQNSCPMNIRLLSYDECELLNIIGSNEVPAGKYCDKFVTIEKRDNGPDRPVTNIKYPSKDQTDRLNEKRIGSNLFQFLNAIIIDAKKQRVERLARMKAEIAEAEAFNE